MGIWWDLVVCCLVVLVVCMGDEAVEGAVPGSSKACLGTRVKLICGVEAHP